MPLMVIAFNVISLTNDINIVKASGKFMTTYFTQYLNYLSKL